MSAFRSQATLTTSRQSSLTSVVEAAYTTSNGWRTIGKCAAVVDFSGRVFSSPSNEKRTAMAFVRRKGNAYYLVHNVRHGGKVQQLHLAKLGERARITDNVVREVSKKHPFVELNWRELRDQLDGQIDLANPQSPAVQKMVHTLRGLNLDLADLFPPVVRFSE